MKCTLKLRGHIFWLPLRTPTNNTEYFRNVRLWAGDLSFFVNVVEEPHCLLQEARYCRGAGCRGNWLVVHMGSVKTTEG